MTSILSRYQYEDGILRIIMKDGTYFDGYLDYVNDEEDIDGIDEISGSFTSIDGGFIIIPESEIRTIEIL